MSWIHKLYETYEKCQSMIGEVVDDNKVPLLPICHTTQKAQIEIVIDEKGEFKRAGIVPKEQARTIIPCTEESGGRTSGEAAHPLCDKLQYVAKDYKKFGGEKDPYFESYLAQLEKWQKSELSYQKIAAIFWYVKAGRVIEDLIRNRILFVGTDNRLLKKRFTEKKEKDQKDIFNLLPGRENRKGNIENWQADAFVRWDVEIPGEVCSNVWEDKTLWKSWISYYSSTKKAKTLCYVTGKELLVADQHPAKLRNDGDKAKLISSNDWDGFTFRGRFTDTKKHNTYQTCGVGFEVTQKAHSALRWLISRQGYLSGDQAIVAWAISGVPIPDPLASPLSILGENDLISDDPLSVLTAQNLALKLKRKIAGYRSNLGDTTGVVVMGLDSATLGRMAITFYRELTGSDFLEKLDRWHESCAWIHDYGYNKETKKHIRFVGAPAPRDIAEAAYGSKVDDKLKKATVERILPCIIDGQKIPSDIVESTVRRACNRVGMEGWEWNKALSIACALFRKLNEKEGYDMALDEKRKTRDYLYGRLLAAADCMERFALFISEKKRDTNAARLMQRFSDRPCSTWKTIELSLIPYKARLGGRSKKYQDVIDEVHSMFDPPEDYISDEKLSGEFLLGYHCQREALKPKKDEPESIDDVDTEEK